MTASREGDGTEMRNREAASRVVRRVLLPDSDEMRDRTVSRLRTTPTEKKWFVREWGEAES